MLFAIAFGVMANDAVFMPLISNVQKLLARVGGWPLYPLLFP